MSCPQLVDNVVRLMPNTTAYKKLKIMSEIVVFQILNVFNKMNIIFDVILLLSKVHRGR